MLLTCGRVPYDGGYRKNSATIVAAFLMFTLYVVQSSCIAWGTGYCRGHWLLQGVTGLADGLQGAGGTPFCHNECDFFKSHIHRFVERYANFHVEAPAYEGKPELLAVFFGEPDTDAAFDAFSGFVNNPLSLENA